MAKSQEFQDRRQQWIQKDVPHDMLLSCYWMSPLDLLESFTNKDGESDEKEFETHYAMCKDITNQNLKFKIALFDDLSKFITVLVDSENRSIDCLNQCIEK